MLTLRSAQCLTLLALAACSVDHRSLDTSGPPTLGLIDGAAGAGAGADASAAGDTGGAATTGDAGGAPGQGGTPADVPQMTTTVTSWPFDADTDIGDWQPEPGVEQSFGAADADGNVDSGSLVVTVPTSAASNDFVTEGSSVCVSIDGGVAYDFAAEIEIDPGQSAGSGGLDVEFFDDGGCDGGLLDLTDFLTATTGSWQLGEKMQTAPLGARSALFRLVASKRASDPPFSVHFDDVRVRPE